MPIDDIKGEYLIYWQSRLEWWLKGASEVVSCEMDVMISKKQSCIQFQCWNWSWKLEGVKKDMKQIVNSLLI